LASRRSFLKSTALVALSPSVPAFLDRTARAARAQRDERILVVVQLTGGNDGINTVVPYADEGYRQHRNVLRLPTKDLLRIDDNLGLHPAMGAMAKLLERGRLAIVQGVGYPNPNRSHFQSMAYWHTARFDPRTDGSRPDLGGKSDLGWLGRALDGQSSPKDKAPASVFIGLKSPPLAVRGARAGAASFNGLDELALPPAVDATITGDGGRPESDLGALVRRNLVDAYTVADMLAASSRARRPDAAYPSSGLAGQLRLVGRMIKADFGARVYYVEHGDGGRSYDTHSGQLLHHERMLEELSGALGAFQSDLEGSGLAGRAAVLVFSEFGRRVAENATHGTDHGTSAPVFLIGGTVRGGLVGMTPSLTDLEDGDLKTHIDFRRVYAAALAHWLGLPSHEALGGAFEPLLLFQGQAAGSQVSSQSSHIGFDLGLADLVRV
jgi:uncharacterized protein (DUF1501 family)